MKILGLVTAVALLCSFGASGQALEQKSASKLSERDRAAMLSNCGNLKLLASKEEKEGHYSQAAQLYSRLGEVYSTLFGQKDQLARDSYTKSAELFIKVGDKVEASRNLAQAIACGSSAFGSGSPELLPMLEKLSGLYSEQHKLPEAQSCYSQIVAINERQYGAADPRTVAAKNKLCTMLEQYANILRESDRAVQADAIDQRIAGLRATMNVAPEQP